jgi:alpha-amylase/alpha-mannosidase (GH57 family)
MDEDSRTVGPRGGRTTRTPSGMVKKNLWVSEDLAEALREKAYHERRTEAEILRQGLRLVLGFEEEAAR